MTEGEKLDNIWGVVNIWGFVNICHAELYILIDPDVNLALLSATANHSGVFRILAAKSKARLTSMSVSRYQARIRRFKNNLRFHFSENSPYRFLLLYTSKNFQIFFWFFFQNLSQNIFTSSEHKLGYPSERDRHENEGSNYFGDELLE